MISRQHIRDVPDRNGTIAAVDPGGGKQSPVTVVCARDCYDSCSLRITLDKRGGIASVRGDSSHPITRGITCPRAAGDPIRLYRNRIETPMVSNGSGHGSVSWDDALDRVSARLRQTLERHGPSSVLYLAYAGNAGLLSEAYPQRLWFALGATQTDWSLCCNSGHKALALHYGGSHGILPRDLLAMDLIVFWGFNAAVSAPHLWALALKARKERGAVILVIDPIRTRTAKKADLWLRPRPGTDVALAYGMINALIARDCADQDFISQKTLGFDRLRESAGDWSPETVAGVTGISVEQLDQAISLYARCRPSATLIGIGLQKCGHGADQVRAIGLIPAILGYARGFFYSNGKADLVNSGLVSGKTLTRQRFQVVEQVALPALVNTGAFKFIYVSGMNPAMTLPDQNAFRKGLERKDVFVAVHETHWTETARLADVVLPAPTFLEKQDLVIPWSHNWVGWSPQAVLPVTDSRTEVWVMQDLARRMGVSESWVFEEPLSVVEKAMTGALEDGNFQDLLQGKRLRLRHKSITDYGTPSGKIELASSRARDLGFSPVPVQPVPVLDVKPEHRCFTLVTSATSFHTSTQFQEVYGPVPAVALLNPEDAGVLGIDDKDRVVLANDLGRVTLEVRVSEDTLPGVIWAPRQSMGLDRNPLNSLMGCVPQVIGSGPRFHSTWVTVQKHP